MMFKLGKRTYLYLLIVLLAAAGLTIFSPNGSAEKTSPQKQQIPPQVKLAKTGETLKMVHFTDVHVDSKGIDNNKRLLADSITLFQDAIEEVNAMKDVDLVVFSGDFINKPLESDFMKFIKMANTLNVPWYASTGNHDIGIGGGVSKKKFVELLNEHNKGINTDKPYYAISPKNGYMVIFLDGVIDTKITPNGYFPRRQLDWLDKELKNNVDKKVVLVQHFPVFEPYRSRSHRVINAKEYLKVIDKHKNVIALLSGHYHAAKIKERNGVAHISTPALVEYPNAYRVITIKDSGDTVQLDYELKETRLKNLQQKSKSRSNSTVLKYGKPSDRNGRLTIEK